MSTANTNTTDNYLFLNTIGERNRLSIYLIRECLPDNPPSILTSLGSQILTAVREECTPAKRGCCYSAAT